MSSSDRRSSRHSRSSSPKADEEDKTGEALKFNVKGMLNKNAYVIGECVVLLVVCWFFFNQINQLKKQLSAMSVELAQFKAFEERTKQHIMTIYNMLQQAPPPPPQTKQSRKVLEKRSERSKGHVEPANLVEEDTNEGESPKAIAKAAASVAKAAAPKHSHSHFPIPKQPVMLFVTTPNVTDSNDNVTLSEEDESAFSELIEEIEENPPPVPTVTQDKKESKTSEKAQDKKESKTQDKKDSKK